MKHIDAVIMFVSLWLLASMLLDALTPPELNVYMIGAALAPSIFITALLYWLRIPPLDFALAFATVWMVSEMVLEMITPKPLSPVLAAVAVAPLLMVGALVNIQAWRLRRGLALAAAPKLGGGAGPSSIGNGSKGGVSNPSISNSSVSSSSVSNSSFRASSSGLLR